VKSRVCGKQPRPARLRQRYTALPPNHVPNRYLAGEARPRVSDMFQNPVRRGFGLGPKTVSFGNRLVAYADLGRQKRSYRGPKNQKKREKKKKKKKWSSNGIAGSTLLQWAVITFDICAIGLSPECTKSAPSEVVMPL